LIFVAFLVPLALYLLVLGYLNRQPRPVMVSGTWDWIGILFAASGFLLCGGPALLSSLNERWRMFWLLGDSSDLDGLSSAHILGITLAGLYFLVVVLGSSLMFLRQRRLTSIYNVEPATVGSALDEACEQFGLEPIRSGNLWVFGLSLEGKPTHPPPEGIQASPQQPPAANNPLAAPSLGQSAILELEPFAAGKHVTLRWEPHDSPLRPVLEADLDRRLAEVGAPEHDTGLWLTLIGFGLLAVSMLIVFVIVLRALLAR
jgi:hypothetical protein